MKLSGKIALVTGAARGIGRGARSNSPASGRTWPSTTANDPPAAEAVVDEIRALGRRAEIVEGDAFDATSCERIVARALEAFGRIDILISNPAFSIRGDFLDYEPETFEKVLRGTLTAGFFMSRLVARHMVERGGGGKIVFISSVHAETPYARSVAYNAGKAGLNHMAKTIAAELATHRINVNVIEPGWIDTPGEREFFSDEAIREAGPRPALGPDGHARGHRQDGRLPRVRRCRLHHRRDPPGRWRLPPAQRPRRLNHSPFPGMWDSRPRLSKQSQPRAADPHPPRRSLMAHFTWLDIAVFVAYLLASVAIGVSFTRGQRGLSEYFLAGRDMGRIILGMTILAALFSGISFLAAPSEGYANGFAFYLVNLGFFIATPITTLLILPFFYQSRFYTAYQYLEERFSVQVRTLASASFILRVLLWLALATYAPAPGAGAGDRPAALVHDPLHGRPDDLLHDARRDEGGHLDRRDAVRRAVLRAARRSP